MNNTGFVYKLVCKDIHATECYVGSTGNTRIRKAHHKHDCNKATGTKYNFRVYQYIRENDGFKNWDMIVLETVQYNQKYELKARERHHMEALGATLNSCVPNRNKAEWYQDNFKQINERHKEYRVDNAEQINEQRKEYYENNAEELRQKANQKYTCDCGGKYTYANKTCHEKTIKHQKHLGQK
jgi:hypothetical protein